MWMEPVHAAAIGNDLYRFRFRKLDMSYLTKGHTNYGTERSSATPAFCMNMSHAVMHWMSTSNGRIERVMWITSFPLGFFFLSLPLSIALSHFLSLSRMHECDTFRIMNRLSRCQPPIRDRAVGKPPLRIRFLQKQLFAGIARSLASYFGRDLLRSDGSVTCSAAKIWISFRHKVSFDHVAAKFDMRGPFLGTLLVPVLATVVQVSETGIQVAGCRGACPSAKPLCCLCKACFDDMLLCANGEIKFREPSRDCDFAHCTEMDHQVVSTHTHTHRTAIDTLNSNLLFRNAGRQL